MSLEDMTIQHMGYDIPYEVEPSPDERLVRLQWGMMREILSHFKLSTRILIAEALWGVDIEEVSA